MVFYIGDFHLYPTVDGWAMSPEATDCSSRGFQCDRQWYFSSILAEQDKNKEIMLHYDATSVQFSSIYH